MTKTTNIPKGDTLSLPKGYKNSPLGIIPEDWEVKKLSETGIVQTGNTPPTSNRDNYGNKYLFVSPFDINGPKYITDTEKKLSEKGFSISRQFPKGAVLFTCIGSTIGKIAIASDSLTSNQQINAVITNEKNDNEFIFYQLLYNVPKIRLIAGEQAVPIINKSQFENVKLLLPPLPEQQKIAEILSTWDAAIEKQNQLIQQLELRKRGLMQQLLTGKLRLRSASGERFEGEWKKVKLGDVLKEGSKNAVLDTSKYRKITIKLYKQGITFSENTRIMADTRPFYIRKAGEIIIGKQNYFNGSIAIVEKEFDGCICSNAIMSFSVSPTVNTKFIYETISQNDYLKKREMLANGTGQKELSEKDFQQFYISLPSLPEQTAIAEVLTSADNQIELEKQKLDALRNQKKGLMQVLLSGKVRVV